MPESFKPTSSLGRPLRNENFISGDSLAVDDEIARQRIQYQQLEIAKQQSRMEEEEQQEEGVTEQGVTDSVTNVALQAGANLLTGQLLKNSWLYLIPSFGLTILYIDFHFFARYLLGSEKFCKFGEEWALKNSATREMTGGIQILEFIAFGVINLLLFSFIGLVATLLYALADPAAVFKQILGTAWAGIKSFFTL
jgi:hypothetical protein